MHKYSKNYLLILDCHSYCFTEKTGVGGRVWGVGVKRNSCRKWTPYSTPKLVESP